MKGRPIQELVYEQLFPRPRPGADPESLHAFLHRYLIQEVRHEVHSFYGHIETLEARYPGLDYNHRIHRLRLCRWPWHRRLFKAFDNLRLTHNEIAGLTRWEGTKWAKDRYESETGHIIEDTTAEGFPDYRTKRDTTPQDSPGAPTAQTTRAYQEIRAPATRTPLIFADVDGEDEEIYDEDQDDDTDNNNTDGNPQPNDDEDSDKESDDTTNPVSSVGQRLNEQIIARLAARDAATSAGGGNNASAASLPPLDEEWEQWLKNVIETGQFPEQIARLSQNRSQLVATDIFPQHMVAAARAGNWVGIPEFLYDLISDGLRVQDERAAAQAENVEATASTATVITGGEAMRYTATPTDPAEHRSGLMSQMTALPPLRSGNVPSRSPLQRTSERESEHLDIPGFNGLIANSTPPPPAALSPVVASVNGNNSNTINRPRINNSYPTLPPPVSSERSTLYFDSNGQRIPSRWSNSSTSSPLRSAGPLGEQQVDPTMAGGVSNARVRAFLRHDQRRREGGGAASSAAAGRGQSVLGNMESRRHIVSTAAARRNGD